MASLRPPHQDASSIAFPHPPRFVLFRHPGYADSRNIIFKLPALDCDPQTNRWGVNSSLALRACSVMACNRNGSLFPQRVPAADVDRVDANGEMEKLLTGASYYFYPQGPADAADDRYAICLDFPNWQFPETLPAEFLETYTSDYSADIPAQSQVSLAVTRRDGSCRITNFSEGAETAHLVPRSETDWFRKNQMAIHNLNNTLSGDYITFDITNCLLLRTDIHKLFDKGTFVFYPSSTLSSSIYFLRLSNDYGPLFHNRSTYPLAVAPEFVYARFAWAILRLCANFVAIPGTVVRGWNRDTCAWEEWEEAAHDNKRARTKPPPPPPPSPPPPPPPSSQRPTTTPPQEPVENTNTLDLFFTRFPDLCQEKAYSTSKNWNRITYYPGCERVNKLKERYLTEKEPVLHARETKRLRYTCPLGWEDTDDAETAWENDGNEIDLESRSIS